MSIVIGPKAAEVTFQTEWEDETTCIYCRKSAELIMAVADDDKKGKSVFKIHGNGGVAGKWWPHDNMAVALYFCRHCFKITAEWNQA